LRHRSFFSLAELNEAIRELLVKLNQRKFRKLDTTRAKLFEELERPVLKPLPAEPFTFAEWKKARVHPDYHIEIERHYYSVSYQLVGEQVEARYSETIVEIFHKGQRITTHARSFMQGRHTTRPEHRPKKHQDLAWTSSRLTDKGKAVGPSTASILERIMQTRKYPELGYRACMGVLRLAKGFTDERLEAACRRALVLNISSYQSIKSILKKGLDRQDLEPAAVPAIHAQVHVNVRGADYYRESKEVV
jgi:transposase